MGAIIARSPLSGLVNTRNSVVARIVAGRYQLVLLAALLIGVTILNLWTLLRSPAPFVDEGWNANRAVGLLETGSPFGSLDAGVFDRYPGYAHYFPLLGTWIHALAIQMLGLSLFSMRFASLMFGVLLLILVYIIASRLGGLRAGFCAMILVACSNAFLYSSHLGRHDIMVAVFGFGALACYVTDTTPRFSIKALLSGLLVALTLEIHMNGVIFGLPMLALYLLDYGPGVFRKLRFWAFTLGGCAGLAFYIMLHILPDPDSYFTIFRLGGAGAHTPPILLASAYEWLLSILSTIALVVVGIGWQTPLLIVACLVLGRRFSTADKKLLLVFATLLLAFMLVVRNRQLHYAILLAPAASLLVALWIAQLSRESWRNSAWGWARVLLVGCVALVAVLTSVIPTFADKTEDYQRTADLIDRTIPVDSTILGPETYWFALPSSQYYSLDQLVYYRRATPGGTVADVVRALHPRFIVLDDITENRLTVESPSDVAQFKDVYVPKTELESFLIHNASLVGAIETATYGRIRIYKLNKE